MFFLPEWAQSQSQESDERISDDVSTTEVSSGLEAEIENQYSDTEYTYSETDLE